MKEGVPEQSTNKTEEHGGSILPEAEAKNLLSNLKTATFADKWRRIVFQAKEKDVSPEELQRELRTLVKERICSPEKVNHFHATGISALRTIAELGGLLSRSEIKKRKPDIELSSWSASDDVMLTRDVFDKKEHLFERGLTSHGIGASSSEVVLVFNNQIINLDSYDALSSYPTASDIPLRDVCSAVLVRQQDDIEKVQSILQENGLEDIEVFLQKDWEDQHYSQLERSGKKEGGRDPSIQNRIRLAPKEQAD